MNMLVGSINRPHATWPVNSFVRSCWPAGNLAGGEEDDSSRLPPHTLTQGVGAKNAYLVCLFIVYFEGLLTLFWFMSLPFD